MKKLLLVFFCGTCSLASAQSIRSNAPVLLPQSPAAVYEVQSGQSLDIISSQSVTLGPGTHLSTGSTVVIKISPVGPLAQPELNNPEMNWVFNRIYDEDGNVLKEGKNFYDLNGVAIQSQVRNEVNGQILATEPLFDAQHRVAGSTLAAPINNTQFIYKDGFVTNASGGRYSYNNFDLQKTNNPDGVGQSQAGTLGWYYSNNNTLEPYVAATAYPYSRFDFYHDGTGSSKRSAGVGDPLRMGSGHELFSGIAPVISELDRYLEARNKFFPASEVGEVPVSMNGKGSYQVITDPQGQQTLSIADASGKPLMSGRADAAGWLTVNNSVTLNQAHPGFELNIGTGSNSSINDNGMVLSSFSLASGSALSVIRSDNVTVYNGNGNDFNFNAIGDPAGGAVYRVTSSSPFYYAYNQNVASMPARLAESATSTVHYFHLLQPQTVSISGDSYRLTDMKSETDITGTFALAPGYYKLTANNGYGSVTLSYHHTLADIYYNFYNQLGQLTASIAPNGVQRLLTNLNAYASISQVPFATRYEYDMEGRLIANINSESGRTEYIYRKDGHIRFSQNALQRNGQNAGSGNAEKFSYTNYDMLGRPVESGEYVVPNGSAQTFQSLKANSSVLESVTEGGLSGGVKNEWVRTHYDQADNSHGLSGYNQEESFLKSAVSWTENENSKTWYNYDSQGRVVWVIRQLAGLGNKTFNYVYDAQGNVTKVDYQRENAAERFVHHYDYDLSGNLTRVMTSRDDINKVQQAGYTYYLHGPLKRIELGDQLQGIDYTYTAQGLLKSVNHASQDPLRDPGHDGNGNSFAADAFSQQLEYFNGDYTRSGTNIGSINTGQPSYYNGNVNGISWQSKKTQGALSIPGIQNPAMYAYSYDNKYQMTGATWGAPDYNTYNFSAGNTFRETVSGYDANGNMQGLQRFGNAGQLIDNFNTYQYQSGTNQLSSVSNYASYTYDELGQLKSEQKGSSANYLRYNVMGKITAVYADAAMTQLRVSYTYDEAGNRISRTDGSGTTRYVYDHSGNLIALYNNTALTEVPVYGADKLGTYMLASNSYQYELRDNTGSVRVVINRNRNASGQVDVVQYNDYYPFGSLAQSGGAGYRYEYQGAYAEKDPVTGWNNFELRMYDGKIGRWLSTDPYAQYDSPYLGMGNNPVNSFDPDGGYSLAGALWRQAKAFFLGQDPSAVYKSGNEWGFNSGGSSHFHAKSSNSSSFNLRSLVKNTYTYLYQLGPTSVYYNYYGGTITHTRYTGVKKSDSKGFKLLNEATFIEGIKGKSTNVGIGNDYLAAKVDLGKETVQIGVTMIGINIYIGSSTESRGLVFGSSYTNPENGNVIRDDWTVSLPDALGDFMRDYSNRLHQTYGSGTSTKPLIGPPSLPVWSF
jgi:RHS repeat-associated protein